MIDVMGWSAFLFAAKWVLVGLIYLSLFVILFAVRRELRREVGPARPAFGLAPGKLRVISPGSDRSLKPGQSLVLKLESTLGADRENDLVLRDQFVSAQHASLRWDGNGWWLEDLGSKNGTQLNGTPCFPHMPVQVPSYSRIAIGDIQLELLDT